MLNDNNPHALDNKCFSWKPVIVGALVAVGLSFLLNLFSVAIGLSAYTADSQGVENLMLGGLMATSLGIVASMFVSGWLAGYLGRHYCTGRHLGSLYGFLAWCVALIIMVFFADYVAKYLAYYSHFISGSSMNAVSLPTEAVRSSASGNAETKAVVGSYILFTLFFLSALASTFGGHCGMRHKCREE